MAGAGHGFVFQVGGIFEIICFPALQQGVEGFRLIEFGGNRNFLFQVGERSPDQGARVDPEHLHDLAPVEGQCGAFFLRELAFLVLGHGGLKTLEVLHGRIACFCAGALLEL